MAKNNDSAATIGFENELWRAADALRSNMDAAEYKHVVLGLIFLKYISDAFAEYHAQLLAEVAQGAAPEDPDEYRAVNIFWVPQEARWSHLLANATQTANKLSFWANDRLFRWLEKRHKKGARWVMRRYRHREKKGRRDRWNLGVQNDQGQVEFLYQMTDLHRRIYYARIPPHPYLTEQTATTGTEDPFPHHWEGQTTPEKADWAEVRLAVLTRDGYCCTQCGSQDNLHVHHTQPRRKGGENQMDNLQTLCESCHMGTTPWGRPKGTGSTQSRRAG